MLLGLLHAVTAQPACSRGSPCKNNGTCEENAGLCTCPLGAVNRWSAARLGQLCFQCRLNCRHSICRLRRCQLRGVPDVGVQDEDRTAAGAPGLEIDACARMKHVLSSARLNLACFFSQFPQDGTLAAGICSHRDYEALKSCSCILQCRCATPGAAQVSRAKQCPLDEFPPTHPRRFSSWGIGEASSRYCYERSVPDEEQTSSFPEPGEPNVKYYDRSAGAVSGALRVSAVHSAFGQTVQGSRRTSCRRSAAPAARSFSPGQSLLFGSFCL